MNCAAASTSSPLPSLREREAHRRMRRWRLHAEHQVERARMYGTKYSRCVAQLSPLGTDLWAEAARIVDEHRVARIPEELRAGLTNHAPEELL